MAKMPLRKRILCLTLAFMAAVGSAACESRVDIDRKPAVTTTMVDESLAHVSTKGPLHGTEAEYSARLSGVLMECWTKDLDTLRDHGVTICLDQRLGEQTNGFWDQRIDAVYYNQGGERVLALWDNGTSPSEAGFWSMDAYDYGAEAVGKLAESIRGGDANHSIMYAARHTVSTGKSSYTYTRWDTAGDFDQDSIAKNPVLQTPPVVHTPPAPGQR